MNLPEINSRIKELIDYYSKGNVAEFVRLTGISSHQVLNRIFNIDKRTGKYPTPSTNILTSIQTSLPEVSSKWLITGEGEMLNNVNSANEDVMKYEKRNTSNLKENVVGKGVNKMFDQNPILNKHNNKYYENPNGGFTVVVPLIPFTAYASFIEVFNDEYQTYADFGNAYFSVDHVGRGKYVAFKVTNDSMDYDGRGYTPSGAEVLGRELQKIHWADGFSPTPFGWIIVTKTGIMHKDIVGDIDENGCIKLHSRNPSPEYQDFDYPIDDIHSIYKVIKQQI